jgi:Fur family transcriptional regulator, ferric uptake regulator
MRISKEQARTLLRDLGLRVTGPRVAVVRVLAAADVPMSHGEVLGRLGETDWDQATIYRNLVKLRDAGLALVVGGADGVDRYALAGATEDGHRHPHFVCVDCGRIACLPAELISAIAMEGPWRAAVEHAAVELKGACPKCRSKPGAA